MQSLSLIRTASVDLVIPWRQMLPLFCCYTSYYMAKLVRFSACEDWMFTAIMSEFSKHRTWYYHVTGCQKKRFTVTGAQRQPTLSDKTLWRPARTRSVLSGNQFVGWNSKSTRTHLKAHVLSSFKHAKIEICSDHSPIVCTICACCWQLCRIVSAQIYMHYFHKHSRIWE